MAREARAAVRAEVFEERVVHIQRTVDVEGAHLSGGVVGDELMGIGFAGRRDARGGEHAGDGAGRDDDRQA